MVINGVAWRVSQQASRELLAAPPAFPHLKSSVKFMQQHRMERKGPQWVHFTFKRTSSDLQEDFAGCILSIEV
eukprot:1161212-Pelagomonas_calceolata.AAC.2